MTWTHLRVVFFPIGEDSSIRFYRSKSDLRNNEEGVRRTIKAYEQTNRYRLQQSVQQEWKQRQETGQVRSDEDHRYSVFKLIVSKQESALASR